MALPVSQRPTVISGLIVDTTSEIRDNRVDCTARDQKCILHPVDCNARDQQLVEAQPVTVNYYGRLVVCTGEKKTGN